MLLRGVAIVFFQQARGSNKDLYQKSIGGLDIFLDAVTKIYQENLQIVFGKRAGMSRYLYNLWYQLVLKILEIFASS